MGVMSVILTQDVENLGRAGEIVKIRSGYGRNFLIPKGMALLATRGNLAQQEHHRRAIAREQERIQAAHAKVAAQLENISVAIARKVGKDEKLFGSVTSRDIVEALAAQNVELDRRLVHLDEPIRAAGSYDVKVRFSASTVAELKVNVIGIT